MELTIAPSGVLQIDDARLIYRNFEGMGDKYNREGDRNFAVRIFDEDIADELIKEGWNVKKKESRDPDDDTPFMFLPVKVKFNDRGPNIYLESGRARTTLKEDTVGCLDNADILSVNLDIRPYDWVIQEGTPNEKRGRSAYLHSMHVIQEIDRFAERFSEE